MDTVERLSALRLTQDGGSQVEVTVAREFFVTLFLNDRELVTLLCSPSGLDYLAAGFLFSEGLVKDKDDIKKIEVDDWHGVVRVETRHGVKPGAQFDSPRLITSGCGGAATFYGVHDAEIPATNSRLKISTDEIFSLVKAFQHCSTTYLATHGTHSAALCDTGGILISSEDIGRHNAIDKLFGQCLMENIPTTDRLILTSGRISFEILQKVAVRKIPIIISISAPMSLGIKMAEKLGVTLIGFVRGQSMHVYCHTQRVIINSAES